MRRSRGVHAGMGDRAGRRLEQVTLVREPVVYAELAEDPFVLRLDT